MEEPLEQYTAEFDVYRTTIENLIEQTVDLAKLRDDAVQILSDPANREVVRYLTGPPISEDDLNTLVGVKAITAKNLNDDPTLATRVIDLISDGLDQRRFPWVRDGRDPTEGEKLAAVIASAALLANRKIGTKRRHENKKEQEAAVATMLSTIGWKQVDSRRVDSIDDAPQPGEFCRESILGSDKADLLVRLQDRRLLAIECKVSNSEINSIKRLNDATNKTQKWLKAFGTVAIVPIAVLSGVFKLKHLEAAQNQGLTLFWAHDLKQMADWIQQSGSAPTAAKSSKRKR